MKKCKCKKCIYGKQIFWGYDKQVRCEEYGTMPVPKYCDHYKTIPQYNLEELAKKLEELKDECVNSSLPNKDKNLEYVWTIVKERGGE